jgi:NIMA (never in mitosis gene a)-related kinase 1/4/5
MPPEVCKG